jgi:hypothetical protein
MTTNTLRRLAATTAVAIAFSPLANAAGLISDDAAIVSARANLSITLAKTTGDDMARLRSGGFMAALEKALEAPSEKTRVVDYPKPAVVERLRITAVVPPKGMEALPIPVCAEQNNKVLGTWNITAKGDVIPAPWSGAMVSDTPTSAACKAFVFAARDEINQKLTAPVPTAKQ